jgi:hypothetical protein
MRDRGRQQLACRNNFIRCTRQLDGLTGVAFSEAAKQAKLPGSHGHGSWRYSMRRGN